MSTAARALKLTPYTAGEKRSSTPGQSIRLEFIRASAPVLVGLELLDQSIGELERLLEECGALLPDGQLASSGRKR